VATQENVKLIARNSIDFSMIVNCTRNISMSRIFLGFVSFLLLGVPGCFSKPRPSASSSPVNWVYVEELDLSPEQVLQKEKALAAREQLFERLMARLSEVVQADGPAAAVEICHQEAARIAHDVSTTTGVKIGRTSDKLRNPNNRPPSWAAKIVANKPESPIFVAADDGRFGAILPVRLKSLCLTCHGTPNQIPDPVRDALHARYPDDRAIGYGENDLRGWFWVEVPTL
jgi:hypothetical protein